MEANKSFLAEILPKLRDKMDFQWRVQSFSKNKEVATCVAYIDARDVMARLDEVCTFGWERLHTEIKGHLFSGISIVMPDGSKLTKWDCGTESNTEAEKGEASDSFKRAAVNWGVGRFLYDIDILNVKTNEKKSQSNYPYVIDDQGKQVWNITKHCNSIYDKRNEPKTPSSPPVAPEIPQMTEAQKKEIIKFSSMTEIFSEEGRKAMLQWITQPRTEEDAKRQIARYEAHIKEKQTQKQAA
jgi:hypothetical protein